MDRDDGMIRDRPAVVLLKHLHELWPQGEAFYPTSTLTSDLAELHPDEWGHGSPFGKPVTAQRLGRMLATSYGVNSHRLDRDGPRGYTRASLEPVWRRMGVTPDLAPVRSTPPKETGASGASGETGASDRWQNADCRHGVPAGDEPDEWLKGRLRCPECRAAAMAS